MSQRGFTLIELIVVLVVMGILLSIAALNFSDWMRKAQIEKQTRELFTDLNFARSESIFRKRRHSIVFDASANGYAFRRYSSENEGRATGGGILLFSKGTSYSFSRADGSSVANDIFQFDIRGFAPTPNDTGTIRINPMGSGAAFDCIVIATSRINIGKMEGSSCVQK